MLPSHPMRCNRQAGFTLVEIVIVMSLMGLMATVGSQMITSVFTTTKLVSSTQASASQSRNALERVARELREIKYDSTLAVYAITSTLSPGATSISFTRTISGSDVIVTAGLSGSTLNLGYSPPNLTSTLLTGVTAFSMDFLTVNTSGALVATTLPSAVRVVVLTLRTTDPTSGQSVSQSTRVVLRNG